MGCALAVVFFGTGNLLPRYSTSSSPLRHSPYCDLGGHKLPGLGAEEAGLG